MPTQYVQYPIVSATVTGSITSDQGAPNSIGNAWPVKPTDGTNSQGYTASSEAKVSITQPLPAGANAIGSVSVSSSALPAGAATEATLSSLNGKVVAVNTGAVVISSSALPSGAATEATLSSLNGKVVAVNTGAVTVSSSALPTGAATEATLSSLNGKVVAVDTGAVVVSSSALPSGAATEATLSSLNGKVVAVNTGNVTVAKVLGKSSVEIIRNDYSSVNVTTASYVEIEPSTPADINQLDIFDSSGQTLVFAIGPNGGEVDKFNIYPGGNGRLDFFIASGSRLAIKAVSATANSGELDINCFS